MNIFYQDADGVTQIKELKNITEWWVNYNTGFFKGVLCINFESGEGVNPPFIKITDVTSVLIRLRREFKDKQLPDVPRRIKKVK